MRETLYKSYSMKGVELALLLASKNEKTVRSFDLVDGSESHEQYLYAIDHMVRLGIIESDGKSIMIKSPYNEMVNIIVDAPYVLNLRSSDDELSDYCIYPGDEGNMVVLSLSKVRRGSVLMTHMDAKTFFEKFIPEGFIPEELMTYPDPDDINNDEVAALIEAFVNETYINDVRFIVGLDIFNKEGDKRRSLVVLHLPVGYLLVRCGENGIVSQAYEKSIFEKELHDLLCNDNLRL